MCVVCVLVLMSVCACVCVYIFCECFVAFPSFNLLHGSLPLSLIVFVYVVVLCACSRSIKFNHSLGLLYSHTYNVTELKMKYFAALKTVQYNICNTIQRLFLFVSTDVRSHIANEVTSMTNRAIHIQTNCLKI